MITCERCGSVNGQGAKGTSWICGDCRVQPDTAGKKTPKRASEFTEQTFAADEKTAEA
ncbi:hypothetical protein ACFFK0_07010 [Paenibacillus chartarius]|uniref:Uncharacterized protein n=1 Tax=Paenibacillus chartarius TaxID=747481 RepID=A0ABV6DHU5_9BACL